MILRRFMQHFREQNWFAVGLDVIVVIVGIFLGLQVQDWYEERENKNIEHQLVNYLILDTENTIAYLGRMENFYQERLTMGYSVLELLEQDELKSQDRQIFERGIREVNQYNELDNYLNTLRNGNLDQILNPDLRRTIDNFIAVLNTSRNIMQGDLLDARFSYNIIFSKTSLGQSEDDGKLIYYDFEKIRNDEEFRIAISNSIGHMSSYKERSGRIKQYCEILLPILKNFQAGGHIEVENFR